MSPEELSEQLLSLSSKNQKSFMTSLADRKIQKEVEAEDFELKRSNEMNLEEHKKGDISSLETVLKV